VARSYCIAYSCYWLALFGAIVLVCWPGIAYAEEVTIGTYTGSNQAWADWTNESNTWWRNDGDPVYVCSIRFRVGYTASPPDYGLTVRYGVANTSSTSDWIDYAEESWTTAQFNTDVTLYSYEPEYCFYVPTGRFLKVWAKRDSHWDEYSVKYWKLGSVTANVDPPHGEQKIINDSTWYAGNGFLESFLNDDDYFIFYSSSTTSTPEYSSSTYAFTDPDFGWFGNAIWDVLKSLFIAPVSELGQWIFENIGKIKYRSPWGFLFRAVDVVTERNDSATASSTGVLIPFHYDNQDLEMINISDTATFDFEWSDIRTASAFFLTLWFISWIWTFGVRVIYALADIL